MIPMMMVERKGKNDGVTVAREEKAKEADEGKR